MAELKTCMNYINGEFVAPTTGDYLDIVSPSSGRAIGRVGVSSAADVAAAVAAAKVALDDWQSQTVKTRAGIMFRFHELIEQHKDELAELVMAENGKNRAEALASIAKGNETVEYACSLPQLAQGKILEVSRGITCEDRRLPLGIVASIVPFNFPIMVPMWTIPITLTMGNAVILKPSEKVPMTMTRVAELLTQAGVPRGIFQIVNGTVATVEALCDHPDIPAVTFVGSSKVAEIVSRRCRALNKRCIALGGAKNHLVALPDCDATMAARDIVASFAGCCGQRCMAASALLLVGNCDEVVRKVVEGASRLRAGQEAGEVGPLIDGIAKARVHKYIEESIAAGAEILLDGRSWSTERPDGNWVGPTIIMHKSPTDAAMRDEIFGPVLSVLQVSTWHEAIAIENANPYGNAACIYTTVGGHAEWFTRRFRAGMLGVNVGVAVPREPFTFGGRSDTLSKFGDADITGDGLVEFVTHRLKITSKWSLLPSAAVGEPLQRPVASGTTMVDQANFDGRI